jgi:hypothetical protein
VAYKFNVNPRPSITGVPGQRVFSRLINGVQTHYVQLRASGNFTIATAVTSIRNKGSIWAMWNFIGIDENGRDRVLIDGRALRAMSEAFSQGNLSFQRLTSTAAGATSLIESARIYFAHPLAAAPAETVFKERDPRQTLQVFGQLAADALGASPAELVTGGTLVSFATTPVLQIEHGYDDITGELPVFVPSIRQQIVPVASANTQLTEFIKTSNFIRFILIQQDSDAGEVGDIINSFALRADGDDIVGPGQVVWDDILRGQEFEFGGNVYEMWGSATGSGGTPGNAQGVGLGQSAYLMINFQQNGRLSNVLSPALLNLRFEFNVSTSGQAGASNSKIRLTIGELERVAGLVTDKIPYPV